MHPARQQQPLAEERGAAMTMVVVGVLAIALLTVLVQQLASTQLRLASNLTNDDVILAATEAMLDRYASKLSIDPLYYLNYVDESEPIRSCNDPTSSSFRATAEPGNPWYPNCDEWDYLYTPVFYEHPLLNGEANSGDEAGVQMQIDPPDGAAPLTITAVGRRSEGAGARAVAVQLRADPVSGYSRVVEGDIRYGSDATTYGKIYAGGNIGYLPGGEAHGHVFSESQIGFRSGDVYYGPPMWLDGAEGWDSTGDHNSAGAVVTGIYPDPLDFDAFWDDLALLQSAACGGGGICLDPATNPSIPSDTEAYLIESNGADARITVSYATSVPSGAACLTSEARWTVDSESASWTALGTYDVPANGALWASETIVIGRDPYSPFTLHGAMTVYAGTSSVRRNVVIGSDTLYAEGVSGEDLLGVVASGEVWVSPNAVGGDLGLTIHGAILSQSGEMKTALECGTSGSNLVPTNSQIETVGSNASIGSSDMACCFASGNYNFDRRLAYLRPPYFPLLGDHWMSVAWREVPIPCWAKSGCA